MKKVKVPNPEEVWQCPRCKQEHCGECVEKHEVNFLIEDSAEGFEEAIIQWKGLLVCPWCYNQLIDLKMEKKK